MVFKNRKQAAISLEKALRNTMPKNALLLALSSGGSVVAFEVAKKAGMPFKVLGPELEVDFSGRPIVLLDDGSTPAETLKIARDALDEGGATSVTFATPICLEDVLVEARADFDDVVCLEKLPDRVQVSAWYDEFPEISDEEVETLLEASAHFIKQKHAA